MDMIFFWAAAVIVIVLIASKLPGLEHFVKPFIDLLFYLLKAVLGGINSWSIWGVKALWKAHVDVFRNLTMTADAIDPTVSIDEGTKQ